MSEEYEFKDGGTLSITNGEDGVTVSINIGKPMIGTYNDIIKLAQDIGIYIANNRPQVFWDDTEPYKIAELFSHICKKHTINDYMVWLQGK